VLSRRLISWISPLTVASKARAFCRRIGVRLVLAGAGPVLDGRLDLAAPERPLGTGLDLLVPVMAEPGEPVSCIQGAGLTG